MNNSSTVSVKNFSEEECLLTAYYFYNVSRHVDDFKDKEEAQELYNELVKKLGLKEHASNVLKALIAEKVKHHILTPCDASPFHECGHPFNFSKKISEHFDEDDRIFDNTGMFDSETLFDIDLCRVVFGGRKPWMDRVIFYTFFTPPAKSPEEVKIRKDDVIPPALLKDFKKDGNAAFLRTALDLTDDETLLLKSIYYTHAVKEIQHFCSMCTDNGSTRLDLYSWCTGLPISRIQQMMKNESKIIKYGFCEKDGSIDDDFLTVFASQDLESYFTDIVKEYKKKTFSLDSFSIKKEETSLIQRFLTNEMPCNLLLYGTPGSGKTQYALASAKNAGLKAYVYRNEMEVDSDEDNAEHKALCRLNCLLSVKKQNAVIIIDEAETMLKTCDRGFFGMMTTSPQKGTVNRMLDESPNKVIWIVNYTDRIDESTRRRFTYSIPFPKMPSSMLRNIASTKLKSLKVDSHLATDLLDIVDEYHVTGSSVDNMVKTLKGMDLSISNHDQVVSDIKSVLKSNSVLLEGKASFRDKAVKSYDLGVINSSVPASRIVSMVQNACNLSNETPEEEQGIRMLFYGMSGTGKTELARYIAQSLNKRIILKRASDILSPYVGQNEQNIRMAFEEASASGSVLLFDEADSFFADRSSARSQWERTEVNEFLTQMEEFKGILICTTNLKNIMDPALSRRFHIMAEFKALDVNGTQRLLNSYFPGLDFDRKEVSLLASSGTVTPGDFGSLKGRMRFMDRNEVTPTYVIEELNVMQKEKKDGVSRKVGFNI